MENKAKRLLRFQQNPPIEIIETLLNSIDNHFNREIEKVAEQEIWLFVMLGIHAVSLTITESIFNKRGLDGFKFFLENFIDKNEEGFIFSEIAEKIHNWRNIIAHQWLSTSGYDFGLDFDMPKGWENRGGITYFNPKLYYQAFKESFSSGGKIWKYSDLLSEEEAEQAKLRMLEKYQNR